jgi:hypothetical protein
VYGYRKIQSGGLLLEIDKLTFGFVYAQLICLIVFKKKKKKKKIALLS